MAAVAVAVVGLAAGGAAWAVAGAATRRTPQPPYAARPAAPSAAAATLRPDHPNAVRIRRFEEAAGAGDAAGFAAVYAPDIVVHAGTGAVGGSTRGRQALLDRIATTARVAGGTLRGQTLHVAANDSQAVVVFRVTARRGARTLDTTLLEVWRLGPDGRAVEIWDHFHPSRAAWDAFWND